MELYTDEPRPQVGQCVMYYSPRHNPGLMMPAIITRVGRRELVALIPQRTQRGWEHANPDNLIRFTWREGRRKWGEKNDMLAYDCLLFCDPITEKDIRSTFESLGGA